MGLAFGFALGLAFALGLLGAGADASDTGAAPSETAVNAAVARAGVAGRSGTTAEVPSGERVNASWLAVSTGVVDTRSTVGEDVESGLICGRAGRCERRRGRKNKSQAKARDQLPVGAWT
ncbi:MAG: hypothetical protein ACK6BG_14180 [Cyanobacteriota bacterium]